MKKQCQPSSDEYYLKERTATALIGSRSLRGQLLHVRGSHRWRARSRQEKVQLRLASAHLDRNNASEALRILYEAREQHPDDDLITQIIADIQGERF